jgi:hypothetical protein
VVWLFAVAQAAAIGRPYVSAIRIHYVDLRARLVGDDSVEDVGKLNFVLVARNEADVRYWRSGKSAKVRFS